MAENGAHFSGEGHLIEGQVEGDPNKTVVPVAVDSQGHLLIDIEASTITIGNVQITEVASGNIAKVDNAGDLQVDVNNFPSNQNVTVTNGAGASAVNIQDGGNSITVDGTVTTTPSGTQNVNIVSTIPVPVTDNGGSLTIDGTVSVSGSVAVTGPLTDAQLRASPVPVSGTFTTSPDVNIHDGTGVSISSTGSSLNVDVTNTVPVTLTSTTITGNVTVVQPTGTNLHTVVDNFPATQPISGTIAATQSGEWDVNIEDTAGNALTSTANALDVNIKSTGVTQPVSGTVTTNQGTSPWVVSGTVTANAGTGTFLVDGSAHTQPVSGTVTANAGTGNFTVIQTTGTNLHTAVDSGTVTANIGTTGGLALDATLTNATQKTKLVDTAGTNVAVVDAAGDLQVDVNNFPATVAVTQSTSPWVISGTVTANAGTGTFQENVAQFGGTNVVTGTGASGAGIPRVTISNDSNVLATQSGTWTVQPGNTPNTAPWLIEQRAPGIASYSASTLGLVAAATPTDVFTIYGSGTKTIKITYIQISATQNTAAIRDVVLIKRSATNTGGTSSSVTAVPYDSSNAGATATVLAYTANPASLGASVGNVRTAKFDIPATNLVGSTDRIEWTFGERPSQAIVLRGTAQGLAINLNSVTSGSNSFDIVVEWTEE